MAPVGVVLNWQVHQRDCAAARRARFAKLDDCSGSCIGAAAIHDPTRQIIRTDISRSPSALSRTTGATCRGKIADAGSYAAERLCETRKKRATASRFLFKLYKLHIA